MMIPLVRMISQVAVPKNTMRRLVNTIDHQNVLNSPKEGHFCWKITDPRQDDARPMKAPQLWKNGFW